MAKISVENDKIFRVSLPGYDVSTATPEQCALHSGFDYPKIEEHLEGYEVITMPSSIPEGANTVLTINHNYGYVPSWLVYLDDIDNNMNTEFARLPFTQAMPADWEFRVDSTTTQLKIVFYYVDIWGVGNMTPTDYPNIPGKRFGFKWQVWVND